MASRVQGWGKQQHLSPNQLVSPHASRSQWKMFEEGQNYLGAASFDCTYNRGPGINTIARCSSIPWASTERTHMFEKDCQVFLALLNLDLTGLGQQWMIQFMFRVMTWRRSRVPRLPAANRHVNYMHQGMWVCSGIGIYYLHILG